MEFLIEHLENERGQSLSIERSGSGNDRTAAGTPEIYPKACQPALAKTEGGVVSITIRLFEKDVGGGGW